MRVRARVWIKLAERRGRDAKVESLQTEKTASNGSTRGQVPPAACLHCALLVVLDPLLNLLKLELPGVRDCQRVIGMAEHQVQVVPCGTRHTAHNNWSHSSCCDRAAGLPIMNRQELFFSAMLPRVPSSLPPMKSDLAGILKAVP